MKYYESDKKSKKIGSTGFYAIIACCLIAIGGASWFAVAKLNAGRNNNESNINSNKNEYNSPESSYNSPADDILQDNTQSENTAAEQSKVPYSSETPKTEEKRSFVLPINGDIVKPYSDTALQYSATYGDMRLHTGIDIKCEKNAQIKAAGQGTVSDIKDDASYGKTVVIDHGDGIKISYCGLQSVNVETGGKVSSGDVIGTAGTIPCECSDGVHLHLSATVDGKVCSPLKAMGME